MSRTEGRLNNRQQESASRQRSHPAASDLRYEVNPIAPVRVSAAKSRTIGGVMSRCTLRATIPLLLGLTLLSTSACAAAPHSQSPTPSQTTAGPAESTPPGTVVSRSADTTVVVPSPSQSPSQDQTSGVQGLAMIAGGPYPGSPAPVPGMAVLVRKGDFSGRVVARTRADASGAFRVGLPPGTYTLTEEDMYAAQTVTVEPGHYVTVTLMIEAE